MSAEQAHRGPRLVEIAAHLDGPWLPLAEGTLALPAETARVLQLAAGVQLSSNGIRTLAHVLKGEIAASGHGGTVVATDGQTLQLDPEHHCAALAPSVVLVAPASTADLSPRERRRLAWLELVHAIGA